MKYTTTEGQLFFFAIVKNALTDFLDEANTTALKALQIALQIETYRGFKASHFLLSLDQCHRRLRATTQPRVSVWNLREIHERYVAMRSSGNSTQER